MGKANQAALIRACLILCRNWFVEDRPSGTNRLGSYEEYSRVMGGILDAAMIPDFLTNATKIGSGERESPRWTALVEAWWTKWRDMLTTAGDLYAIIQGDPSAEPPIPGNADLQIAFADILGDGRVLSQKQRLGHSLAKQEGRVWGGYRIVRSEARGPNKTPAYRLSPMHAANQSEGV